MPQNYSSIMSDTIQDIKLANDLGAVAGRDGVQNEHGVDLLIGGHDHIYYVRHPIDCCFAHHADHSLDWQRCRVLGGASGRSWSSGN